MSRIYPPAAYGEFAVFNSLASNVAMISTLAYTGAFLLPKTQEKFYALMQLSLILTLGTFVLLTIAILAGGHQLMHKFGVEAIGKLIYTLPILLLLFNVGGIISGWYLREKQFIKRVSVDIATIVVGRGTTIGYGWWAHGDVTGFFIGEFFFRLTGLIGLAVGNIRHSYRAIWRTFSWANIRAIALEYKEFPLYNFPAGLVGPLSSQLPIYMLSSGFGPTPVGLYSFSVSLLEIPVNLIGNAILPVFWQKAAETHHNEPERLPGLTLNLYNKLLYLGLLPFGIITIYGDILFKLVFGVRWEMAGVYTGYLGYYYVFKLMSLATSSIYNLMGKQRYVLWTNIALLAVRGVALGIGLLLHNLNLALLLFGLGSLLATFLIDLQVLSLLRLPVFRIGVRTVIIVGTMLIALKGIRMGAEWILG